MQTFFSKRTNYWSSYFLFKILDLTLVIGVIFLFSSSVSLADEQQDLLSSLIKEANAKKLSQSKYWHKLLHYKTSGKKVRSEITSKDFFLNPNGRTDSNAELLSTLDFFFETDELINTHALCRFPARFKWLKENLSFPDDIVITPSLCPEYTEWANNGETKGVSLVFASGHLSNPASFYGHILLKFNSKDQEETNLLDTSLNFGAITSENENVLIYIIKGLAGGYDSTFTHQQFYRHNHKYAENELRDLWNYELNLSDRQVQQIVDHSWEILGKNFTYFFLKQNCGYRMAELLNLVIDERLMPNFKQWAMPSDVFQNITKIEVDGQPLVKNISIIKSRQNAFRDKFQLLTEEEKKIVKEYILEEDTEALFPINRLNESSNKRVIDTLFDYYAFTLTLDYADEKDVELRRRKLIIDRLKLDIGDSDWPYTEKKVSPDKSQHSSLLQLSLLHNNHLGEGLEIRFRAAYYDYLSVSAGMAPFTQMSMFDLKFRVQDKKIKLNQLELFKIETLNISPTGIQKDSGYAWKVGSGVKNMDLSCNDCLHGYVEGGIGTGYSIGKKSAAYAMVIGEFSLLGIEGTQLKSGITAGFLTEHSNWWKTHLEVGILESITSNHKLKKFASWENRFFNNKSWDLRLKLTYDKATEIKLSTGLYW